MRKMRAGSLSDLVRMADGSRKFPGISARRLRPPVAAVKVGTMTDGALTVAVVDSEPAVYSESIEDLLKSVGYSVRSFFVR